MSLNDNMWILPSAIVAGTGAGILGGFSVGEGSLAVLACFPDFSSCFPDFSCYLCNL